LNVYVNATKILYEYPAKTFTHILIIQPQFPVKYLSPAYIQSRHD